MGVHDKEPLLPSASPAPVEAAPAPRPRRTIATVVLTAVLALIFLVHVCNNTEVILFDNDEELCKQTEPRIVSARPDITEKNYNGLFKDEGWRLKAAERLGQSVRINTETFDYLRDLPPPAAPKKDDPKRDGLTTFREWLQSTYPLTHDHLDLDVVNRYALLYTWKGKDETQKPMVLCSHIDTVPVALESLDLWDQPPWSGKVDGGFIWGRGSVDTKNTLVAIVEAVEALLAADFVPERTVILAFGFDEEISGYNGAKFLAQALLDRGLKDNVELLVDEGPGIVTQMGTTFANIGVSEKGYTDVTVTLSTAGGHSSIPPPHTNIGVLARIIAQLEDHPFSASLPDESPFLESLRCLVQHGKDVDPWFKRAVRNVSKIRTALVAWLVNKDVTWKYMMTTSQAVDIIEGGVKLNALPEHSQASINHRIAPGQTVQDVEQHIVKTILPLARHHRLRFSTVDHANVSTVHHAPCHEGAEFGQLVVQTFHGALEVAPISPSSGKTWELLAGTVRKVAQDGWEKIDESASEGKKKEDEGEDDRQVVVIPMLMPANTDTRHYWGLTRHIYRYDPIRANGEWGVHTVNEHIKISTFVESVAFFHELIRGFQEL
ncbi:hypothetical protein HKX48_006902 [Thoreauomyces humboldtii]|nr:hypothetical protein HKX48_006902 [Thoreauomyces humboldtii]